MTKSGEESSGSFQQNIKTDIFTRAMDKLIPHVQDVKVDWNLVQRALLDFTDDVLRVYAADQAQRNKKIQDFLTWLDQIDPIDHDQHTLWLQIVKVAKELVRE